jgi:hypothetical protein
LSRFSADDCRNWNARTLKNATFVIESHILAMPLLAF